MATRTITGSVQGGAALFRHMHDIESALGKGAHVRIGFFESEEYPSTGEGSKALPVAQVAFWNEFGTNPKSGPKTPSRPFFRTMIERKSPRWGVGLGNALKKSNYHAETALAITGAAITGQLKQSINDWTSPPNAARTAAPPPVGKGFNKPLIDTSQMINAASFQVIEGEDADDEND